MENHIIELIKKSLLYFDNQNNKYKNYLKNTTIDIANKNIIDKHTNKNINNKILEIEQLGIFHNETNIFLWSWALPYLGIKQTKTSRELLNYGLKLEPSSNTFSHYFIKTLLINARNYIETNFDLDLIQALSSYILKDKFHFIYPVSIKNKDKQIIITTYFLVKISSNN